MKKVIKLLEVEISELKVDIFNNERFYKEYYVNGIPKSKKASLTRDRKYLKSLQDAVKILTDFSDPQGNSL